MEKVKNLIAIDWLQQIIQLPYDRTGERRQEKLRKK